MEQIAKGAGLYVSSIEEGKSRTRKQTSHWLSQPSLTREGSTTEAGVAMANEKSRECLPGYECLSRAPTGFPIYTGRAAPHPRGSVKDSAPETKKKGVLRVLNPGDACDWQERFC